MRTRRKKVRPMKKAKQSLGAQIDALYKQGELVGKAQAVVAKLSKKYDEMEAALLLTLQTSDIQGAKGRMAHVVIARSALPQLKDWAAFTAYVAKYKAFELFQRRVSATAWRERVDAGLTVAGVESFIR